MPLNAVRYLLPGLMAGVAAFAFSRVLIAPLVNGAVNYEAERGHAAAHLGDGHSHEHGELFTRSVQENLGAAAGIAMFSIIMGVLFVIAYTVIRAVLERRGFRPDPTGVALVLSAGMFVAVALIPGLKYPANPPGVGLGETVAQRSSAFLVILAISVLSAGVAVAVGLAWARRWGIWRASAVAVGGYLAVMLCAVVLLPSFGEVPGPLTGPDGLVFGGFPAELLADFRLYSLLNQAVIWATIGATFAGLLFLRRHRTALRADRNVKV